MKKHIALIVLALLFTFSQSAEAGRNSSHAHYSVKYHPPKSFYVSHPAFSKHESHAHVRSSKSKKALGVQRDKHGKIKRSQKAKDEFKHQSPCPSTGKSRGGCPGYVIDHVVPLKRGGADSPSNMQWQTRAAAKQKDKWE